ncbi:MAG: hypothetical protein AAGJ18_16820 [Bacteroidota bacterium]
MRCNLFRGVTVNRAPSTVHRHMTITALYQLFLDYPKVCTDTRKIEQDVLFFALKGANFDE